MNPNEYQNGIQQEYLEQVFEPYEKVRVNDVRNRFDFCPEDIPFLFDLYRHWRDQAEYYTLEIRIRQPETRELAERSWVAVKCAKRGNDVYAYRVKQKLEPLKKAIKKISKKRTVDPRKAKLQNTNMLYVTLTYDSKKCSMAEAWRRIGKEHNDFMSRLRSEYGKVSILRSWEAYESGYPHIHTLLVFHDHNFRIFLHNSRNTEHHDGTQRKTYRVLQDQRKKISKMWHSFVDIQGVTDVEQAVKNVLWYIGKNTTKPSSNKNEKMLLTFVATWYHRKRSFSMSTNIIDLIRRTSIIKNISLGFSIPTTLEGQKFIVEYIFLSVELGDELEIDPKEWVKLYTIQPKWAQWTGKL